MKNTTLSTNKIIILVAFACTAIMTFVLVSHMREKPISLLSPDEGIIFPAARDIKSFELVTGNSQIFTEKNFRDHWTLLFFGFTHCSNVCPTTLDMLQRVYTKLHPAFPSLQIVLISLDPERDSPSALLNYTKSFNPDFIGASGKLQELRKIQSQLGIYSARDNESVNYQLQHTASILLIDPKGKWAGLFKYGMNPKQFANAFVTSMRQLQLYSAQARETTA